MWDPVNCWCQSQAGRVSCRADLCLVLLGDLGQRPFFKPQFPHLGGSPGTNTRITGFEDPRAWGNLTFLGL